jgi:hypothetical protein
VYFIAHSIRRWYPDAIIRVTIGDEGPHFDPRSLLPWSERLGVQWVWVERDDFAKWRGTAHPYIATMMERFRPPFTGDSVLMLDADVVAVRPFDEVLGAPGDCIRGVMAHGSPFQLSHAETWTKLFTDYRTRVPAFSHQHSGWGAMFYDDANRFSPYYLNTGVLFGTRGVYETLYEPYLNALAFVREAMDSYFFEQIALTLALYRSRVPFEELPLRFNFPNQPEFEAVAPAELADVRLLHFLRTCVIDRDKDFAGASAVRRLVTRADLSGSNELFRSTIADLPFDDGELAPAT